MSPAYEIPGSALDRSKLSCHGAGELKFFLKRRGNSLNKLLAYQGEFGT